MESECIRLRLFFIFSLAITHKIRSLFNFFLTDTSIGAFCNSWQTIDYEVGAKAMVKNRHNR